MVYRVDPIAESVSPRRQDPVRRYGRVDRRTAASRREAIETAALLDLGVPAPLVARAAAEARWLGLSPDAALLASRRIDEDSFYRSLAERLGVPFVTRPVALDGEVDYAAASAAGAAALARPVNGLRWLVAPRGRAIATLLALPDPAGLAVTTPRRFAALLRAAARTKIADDAALRLHDLEPRLSARRGPTAATRWRAAAAGAAFAGGLLLWPALVAALLWMLLTIAFSVATVVRLFTAAASFEPEPVAAEPPDRELPDYTVVIALYREAGVAPDLVRALEALDYPRARLDVKFVVEADDSETFAALAAAIPGVEYEIVVAPPGAPRTKPRALNVALPFARGELLTIYDAEDRPEPDQLRRAAARFARAGPDLGCVQARLAIDNHADTWLAGLFALDYAALFETINPGLAALRLPMLLGGTSNHFRTGMLRAVGGWDAWNVTEDADLGLRLARCGYSVETFASRTWEEAPITLRALLDQRVRWIKGWMQTAFVHMRDIGALWRNLRPLAFFVTLATFVSGVASPVLWPWFTILLVRDAVSGALFAPANGLDLIVDTFACWLAVAGPVAMVWPVWLGMRRQKLTALWPLLFLLPVWHALIGLAALRAIGDLWRDPFRWAKTEHGKARRRLAPPVGTQQVRAIRAVEPG